MTDIYSTSVSAFYRELHYGFNKHSLILRLLSYELFPEFKKTKIILILLYRHLQAVALKCFCEKIL